MSESLERSLGRLEGKVDQILALLVSHATQLDNHDRRLDKLENWRSWVLGAAFVAGAVASLAVRLVWR